MAVFMVTDPTTGTRLRLTGDSPPSEAELEQIFAQQSQSQPEPEGFAGASFIEPTAALASGIVAEPLAGLAGIAQGLNPFADEGASAEAVKATKEALTFKPRTEAGKEGLKSVGETLAPVVEGLKTAEDFLGDEAFEATGSPAIAAFAKTIPTAALEIIGIGAGKALAKVGSKAEPSKREVRSLLNEAAPSAEKLREVSGQVFKELQDSGVNINPNAYSGFVKNAEKAVKGSGFSRRTTKQTAGLIDDLKDVANGKPVSLNEIADLRKVAQGVAGNKLDATEKMLGLKIIDEIDSFIDNIKPSQLTSGTIKANEIGKKYNAARKLYGRAKKSELITEAIKTAKGRASGFENGLRIELGKLTKNKRTKNFFTKSEKNAIEALKKGDVAQNFSKLLGRFAFNEGRSTNILSALSGAGAGSLIGSAAGGAVGGGFGAIIVPAVGTVARQIAQKLTKTRADFVDTIVRAGNDGEKIAEAYFKSVPKAERSVADLSELLSNPNINLDPLLRSADMKVKQAAEIAAGRQVIGQAIGATGASSVVSQDNQQDIR